MSTSPSTILLSQLTDASVFELLASSLLRRYEPACKNLSHTGMNADGKTVKAPLDGINFTGESNSLHLIAVHHTTCSERQLEGKWLHDPSTVRPRSVKATQPPGDFVKTVTFVQETRKDFPQLKATLFLTTTQEPSIALIKKISLLAAREDIELRIWSRSVLADYLDNYPDGQWYRKQYLGVEQERLSLNLLEQLCRESLRAFHPADDEDAWIARELDQTLAQQCTNQIKFLVAQSGMGKTVACYQWLLNHLNNDGFGLFIPHDVIAKSLTFEQAVTTTLRKLHPSLSGEFSSFSLTKPLFVVVEDINRSGKAASLVEKITSWNRQLREGAKTSAGFMLLCPVWPEVLSAVSEQTRREIGSLLITADGFTLSEAKEALRKRNVSVCPTVSDLDLEEMALALGCDPLLIALYNPNDLLKPDLVIADFIDHSLSRVAANHSEYTSADYLAAMQDLSREMLLAKILVPTWTDTRAWFGTARETNRTLLSHLTQHGELIRLNGPSSSQQIAFRHDRVRDWFLIDVIAKMMRNDTLADSILSDPYYAHLIGNAMMQSGFKAEIIKAVSSTNALSLFYAFKLIRTAQTEFELLVLEAINNWIDIQIINVSSNWRQQYEAATVLAETESQSVLNLLERLPIRGSVSQIGRLRNGDIGGAIELCLHVEPGVGAMWRDKQIDHMKARFGDKVSQILQSILESQEIDANGRIGSLRLAGFWADANLADAINQSWLNDLKRRENIGEYLWAFAMCCGAEAERYLAQVCDEWAEISDQSEHGQWTSPRYQVVAHELRWAFQKWIPINALDYLILRSSKKDLHEPLMFLLQGLDNSKALLHVVKELGAESRELGKNYHYSSGRHDWRTAQESGRTMSKTSRSALHDLWSKSSNDIFERKVAFSFWASTVLPEDLATLRDAEQDDELKEVILRQRLIRGDAEAVPLLLKQLTDRNWEGWLWHARFVWCDDLIPILEEKLEARGLQEPSSWSFHSNADYTLAELLRLADSKTAERIILANWEHLQHSDLFVQSAIYFATPALNVLTRKLVETHPNPSDLFNSISTHLGIGNQFSKGLVSKVQFFALKPYIQYFSPLDSYMLWKECNIRGWFELRKKFVDDNLQEFSKMVWNERLQLKNLDEYVKQNHKWIDRWIDDHLEAGVSWHEIKTLMSKWLATQNTLAAFSLVADAVLYAGKRPDIEILNMYSKINDSAAISILANTKYGLERKTLV